MNETRNLVRFATTFSSDKFSFKLSLLGPHFIVLYNKEKISQIFLFKGTVKEKWKGV